MPNARKVLVLCRSIWLMMLCDPRLIHVHLVSGALRDGLDSEQVDERLLMTMWSLILVVWHDLVVVLHRDSRIFG